ncbi:MAG TPA: gfo/Idh/MocA family oxidoreductase, partial [Sphingobacterium sp.]|nr:gfo/Idh/MocA family oxidoreductase [Sphingobacterium sp.]
MNSSRRHFIKTSGVMLGSLPFLSFDNKSNIDNPIRVGLIGCGGRGNGAAVQALAADPQVHITALADIFPDQLSRSLELLQKRDAARVDVPESRQFIGFDSY